MTKAITGFSKFTKTEKIDWIIDHYFEGQTDKKNIRKILECGSQLTAGA